MLDAPDAAKERAMTGPSSEPPPLMTTFLPFDERCGSAVLIAG